MRSFYRAASCAGVALLAWTLGHLLLSSESDAAPDVRKSRVDEESSLDVRRLSAKADELVDDLLEAVEHANAATESLSIASASDDAKLDAMPHDGDAEWQSYSRTDLNFASWVFALPPRMQAGQLYRSRQLNPDDLYVPRDHRVVFEAYLASLEPEIQALEKLMGEIGPSEADALFGLVPHVEIEVVRRTVTLPDGTEHAVDVYPYTEEPMVIMTRDEKVVGIATRDLPGLRGMHERRALLIMEIGQSILLWFRSWGALTAESQRRLMDELVDWSSRELRLSSPR